MAEVGGTSSRREEKTQLQRRNPPRSATICGIAVATMVASMAIMTIVVMTEPMTSAREEFRFGNGR